MSQPASFESWPELRIDSWVDTRDTLHMWLQIIGKIRMQYAPLINHWWQVTLYLTPRGMSTSAIPFAGGIFDIEFDFFEHELSFRRSTGHRASFALEPMTTAEFYRKVVAAMDAIEVPCEISMTPNEVDPALRFDTDDVHKSYDKDAVHKFWKQLTKAHIVMNDFRAEFIGKVSPVHFFWGAMDLACTRFVGGTAPRHPGGAPNCGDWVMVEGYSHQLSSCGFWPGGAAEGAFYSYAYPAPEGYAEADIQPAEAYYDHDLSEFILPYEAVRKAENPEEKVRQFFESTYDVAARLSGWPRRSLECSADRLIDYKNGVHPKDLL